MYRKGDGVVRDYKTAVRWYRKAAEQGFPNAQFNLGVIYAKGRGTNKDTTLSKEWYEKAADQGNENAERALKKINALLNDENHKT